MLTAVYFIMQCIYPEISLPQNFSIFEKTIYILAINSSKLILGFVGIGIAFIATRIFLQSGRNLPVYIITFSTYCYGVYIFHQFILKYIYYNSSVVTSIHPNLLPWVALLVTLLLSTTVSATLLRTKVGKYLIG